MTGFIVILTLQLAAECNAASVLPLHLGRSKLWDETLENLRQQRQTNCYWESVNARPCTIANVTRYDTLRRRDSGMLADVQNQDRCGSCWAFATAHTYTDVKSLVSGQRTELISPDYITKCVSTRSGNGCCGGSAYTAAIHLKETGVVSDQCLPYTLGRYLSKQNLMGQDEDIYKRENPLTCPRTCADSSAYDTGNTRLHDHRTIRGVPDSTIINILRNNGPVVAIMKLDQNFFHYKCGVLCHNPQSQYSPDLHAVEIVDYGTDSSGVDFWIVKNSWGQTFGENGFIRIRRGDFYVGRFPIVIHILSGSFAMSESNASSVSTCAATEVDNDLEDNIYVTSAVEYGLQELVDRALVRCPDGSRVTGIVRNSVTSASVQTLRGSMVDVTITANVQGCNENNINPATVELLVQISPGGDFTLTDYEYNPGSGGSSNNGAVLAVAHVALVISFSFLVLANT